MKQIGTAQLYHGDSRDVLKCLPENSVDAVLTDPPYNLTSIVKRFGKPGSAECQYGKDGTFRRVSRGFMNQAWDTGEVTEDAAFWSLVYKVLKPGAFLLAFGGTRSHHRMMCAIEDAGFIIKESIAWLFSSGFPKSLNVSNQFHQKAKEAQSIEEIARYALLAQQYQGFGTATKPAFEVIVCARKPLMGTVAENVARFGTGALRIDDCRVGTESVRTRGRSDALHAKSNSMGASWSGNVDTSEREGRWPANVLFSESAAQELDRQSGICRSSGIYQRGEMGESNGPAAIDIKRPSGMAGYADSGSASRFFHVFPDEEPDLPAFIYCAKASRTERERGCEDLPELPGGSNAKGFTEDIERVVDRNRLTSNSHPTVKPTKLLQILARLICPPNGLLLDCFLGSGSTGVAAARENLRFVGIEREETYFNIACKRIGDAHNLTGLFREEDA